MSVTTIPTQTIPYSARDSEWRRNTVEAYIERANFKIGANSYRQWLLKLYDYYNGKIDNADYSYVLEPYGKKRENYPAKIRNFPLIKPAIDLLKGEKAKRPFNFTVVVSDGTSQTIKERIKQKEVNENLQQWYINKLNAAGFQTGIESQEDIQLPEEVEREFERSWRDNRAIMAQKALQYLIPYLHWHEKIEVAWADFLISGYVFTHRGVINDEPFFEVLNPMDVDYDKDPNIDFVEDGNWVVIREMVERSSIIDRFHKFLTKEQIDRLENPKDSNRDVFYWYNREDQVYDNDWDSYAEVATVYWKSLKKVGFRTYIDEFGDLYEEVVDEDYEFNEDTDIDVEWEWINEVWQGYRIDGDIYIDIKPYVHQRSSIDNPSKCKLPVNGRTYSSRNSTNISLVELGIPYQLSYNIFKYRLENAIAKSKDILAMMDINLIPKNWSMDKFMTILEATGIAWVNYQKEGAVFNPQHQAVLDMSIKTIDQYIGLLQYIREEWEFVSGVSRQRMGQTSPYEGKGVTEQSIIQSSHITEDYFNKFAMVEQRDIQALVDYAQIAWVNGKKAEYVVDGYPHYLDIDPDTFTHAEFGVFVKSASKEYNKLQQMQALGQAAIQQGAPMSIITEMIDSENFAELKDKIKKAEEYAQQLQEQAQQMEQELKQAELQEKQADREFQAQQNELDRQNNIDVALVKESDKQEFMNHLKNELERYKIEVEKRLKEKELNEQIRSNKANEKLKEKEIKTKKQSKTQ